MVGFCFIKYEILIKITSIIGEQKVKLEKMLEYDFNKKKRLEFRTLHYVVWWMLRSNCGYESTYRIVLGVVQITHQQAKDKDSDGVKERQSQVYYKYIWR